MTPIRWDKPLETGDCAIDRQHRPLLELLNQTASADTGDHPELEPIEQWLDTLSHWAALHFEAEEALLLEQGVDPEQFQYHCQSHAFFLTQLKALKGQYASDHGPASADDIAADAEPAALIESSMRLFAPISAQDLRLAEINARWAAAALPAGVDLQESDGRIVLRNRSAERILDLTDNERAEGRPSVDPRWRTVDEQRPPLAGERHPSLLAQASGQPRPVLSSLAEVTEGKHFEAPLKDSRQPLDLVLERTKTGIWDWDLESGRVCFSRSGYTMLGFEPGDFPPAFETWECLIHPDDIETAREAVSRLQASRHGQEPYDTVFRMRTKDGDWRWINSSAVVIRRDPAGRPARVVATYHDLTEQRRVERVLQEQQAKRAGLFRAAPIGIAMTIGRVLMEVNDAFCHLTGYRRDELVGRDTGFLYCDQAEYERAGLIKYQCTIEDQIREVDVQWLRKDGTLIDVVLNAALLEGNDPAKGITFTVLDISERKRIEAALSESEEKYRLAMEATDDGLWDWNIATGAVYFSPAWSRILGEDAVGAHYETWATRVHPEDWPEVEHGLQQYLAGTGGIWQQEHRLRTPSGDWKWVLGRGRVVKRDVSGTPLRMVGTTIDISERKAAERERALLSDTLGASLNEIYLFDADTLKFRYVNEGALKNLGYTLETARQLTPLDLKPHLTPHCFRQLIAPLLSGAQKVQVFESVHRRADGSHYPVEVHLQLFRHHGERVYLAIIQDITERQRAEASLRESEERFRLWLDATDSVFWSAGPGGELVQPSPSLERLTGLSSGECLGSGRLAAVHPDDRDAYAASVDDAIERQRAFEFRLRYWDAGIGDYRWYLERGVPDRAEDGTVRGWLGAGVNIDQQKRAEAAQQEMLRRKDEFIAMLGHELRNPLAPIRSANEVLGSTAGQNPTLQWIHGIFDRHINHLVRLIDDLLDVARLLRGKISLQLEPVSVATLMKQVAESNHPLLAARRQHLSVSTSAETLVVRGDAVRLTQAFDNLLGNAARYTPEGGYIWFSATRDGRHAVLRVKDSGTGIPEDLLPHIFDPFAQGDRPLDRTEGGLGIGLTVARQLVVLHNGEIDAHSEGANQGSEFVVRLPLVEGDEARNAVQVEPVHQDVPSVPSPMRILVVDDNLDAACSLTLLLEFYEHDVRSTPDGPQALDIARQFRPDVILLDIGLPGMDGFEVARELRQMDEAQQARIIAVTGYAQPEYRERAKRAGFDEYWVKPIRLDDIRRLIEAPTEGRSSS